MDDMELDDYEDDKLSQSINEIRNNIKTKTLSDNKIKIESNRKKIQKEFDELSGKNSKKVLTITLAMMALLIIFVMVNGFIKENNTKKSKYANANNTNNYENKTAAPLQSKNNENITTKAPEVKKAEEKAEQKKNKKKKC